MKKEDFKILLYSALVSVNIIVWYEVFGVKLFIGIFLLTLYFLFSAKGGRD